MTSLVEDQKHGDEEKSASDYSEATGENGE